MSRIGHQAQRHVRGGSELPLRGAFTTLGLELGGKDPAYVRADADFDLEGIVITSVLFEISTTLGRRDADQAAPAAARWLRPLEIALLPLAIPLAGSSRNVAVPRRQANCPSAAPAPPSTR